MSIVKGALYSDVPSAEKQAAWDGAAEDLGLIFKGMIDEASIENPRPAGIYILHSDIDNSKKLVLVSAYSIEGEAGLSQIIIDANGRIIQSNWNGESWSHNHLAYLSETENHQPKAVNATKSANSSGTKGDMAYDNDYFYICTATNTWVRFSKTAW